jgi:hypothetical protein
MAIFRKIHTSFWSDSFIQDLEKDQKLFYLYLLTNERTRQCGVYEITKKQISYDLGYTMDRVSILLEYFIKVGKIKYNSTTKELAIGNWLKYNNSTSPKVKSCIDKEFGYCKDTVLIEYVKSMDTLSQEEEEQEEEKEKEQIDNFDFKKPSLEDCIEIFKTKTAFNWTQDYAIKSANTFYYFYESKNWMVGKNKMKSLNAAIGGWISRDTKPELSTTKTMDQIIEEKKAYFKTQGFQI